MNLKGSSELLERSLPAFPVSKYGLTLYLLNLMPFVLEDKVRFPSLAPPIVPHDHVVWGQGLTKHSEPK